MKYNKYIISFFVGSSGRFLNALLDRIIRYSSDPIEICPFNSAHLNKTYTGVSIADPNRKDIYNVLEYDCASSKNFKFSNIIHSHTYPDFDTINSRFSDIGIILVKLDNNDIREVIFNSVYKNQGKIASRRRLDTSYNYISNNKHSYDFFKTLEYPKNCLVLKYIDIFEKDGDNYRILEILKEFTGINEIPIYLNTVCEQYISNRTSLINRYNLR